jgi:hypothetical protein
VEQLSGLANAKGDRINSTALRSQARISLDLRKVHTSGLDYMHLNPVRKGLVKRPEEWRWSSYNNFALDKDQVARCPMQIDYVHLPESYRA